MQVIENHNTKSISNSPYFRSFCGQIKWRPHCTEDNSAFMSSLMSLANTSVNEYHRNDGDADLLTHPNTVVFDIYD